MKLFEHKNIGRLKENITKNRLNTLMLSVDDAMSAKRSIESIRASKKYEAKDIVPYRSMLHSKIKVIKKFIGEFGKTMVLDSLPKEYKDALVSLNKEHYLF